MRDGLYHTLDLSWPSILGRNIAQAALEELRVRASLDQAFICIAWALEQRIDEIKADVRRDPIENGAATVYASALREVADTLRRVKVAGRP